MLCVVGPPASDCRIKFYVKKDSSILLFCRKVTHKDQPFIWVFGDHIHDCLPGDASVHHLGHNVLQKVGVPMPSIAGLQMGTATGVWIAQILYSVDLI